MSIQLVLAFYIIITLIVSFLFFKLSISNDNKFIKYWSFSWLSYSASLILLTLSINSNYISFLEIRKIFDMFNLLLLLFGAYSMVHINIPTFWYRFSLYISIWLLLGVHYFFTPLSIYIPVSLYQLIIVSVLCYVIIIYWNITPKFKIMYSVIFFSWGGFKAAFSIFEIHSKEIDLYYLFEIVFSNIILFCVFAIYLQVVQRDIQTSSRLYRILTENASDVIFYYTLEPTNTFTYITPSVENMTGYTPNDFYKNPRFYYTLFHNDYYSEIPNLFSFNGKITFSTVVKIITKFDEEKWVEAHSSVVKDENDYPIAIEGFLHDITVLKDAEQELISSKHSRDVLLSYISHELKTPVTSISGYTSAIIDGTIKTEDEKNKAIKLINTKSIFLERLIKDLFMLSKLETQQFSFQFEEISTADMTKYLIAKHELDIKTNGFIMECNADYSILEENYIIADKERINQVLSNFIINAMKYTPTLNFEIDLEKSFYIVTVTDQGTGIAQEDLSNIFTLFYKSNKTLPQNSTQGNGLGLTLSKGIIDSHNGQIGVHSTLGMGSSFYFSIPLFDD